MGNTEFTVELLINLATVLNLLILVLLAVELPGIEAKVSNFINHILFQELLFWIRLKLLEGLHRIVVMILMLFYWVFLLFFVCRSDTFWSSSRSYSWLLRRCKNISAWIILRLFERRIFEGHLKRRPKSHKRLIRLSRRIHRSSIESLLIIFIQNFWNWFLKRWVRSKVEGVVNARCKFSVNLRFILRATLLPLLWRMI